MNGGVCMETYNKFINNILDSRGRFACGNEYHERHHIIPKCCGGTDDEYNLIDLFAREHFMAHRLLALENPDNDKLIYAWHMMAFVKDRKQERYEITAEEYEEIKIIFAKTLSEARSGEKHPQYGTHRSQETKDKISKNHADVSGENNPLYGTCRPDYVKQKISQANKGKMSHRRNCTPVYCVELNKTFKDATTAGKELDLDSSVILKCCKGDKYRQTCGGYHWNFINLENNIS